MPEEMPRSIMGGTTMIPNSLFDVWLPALSDGELRVLLVVARSTLGWKEGTGRKERDWLSHTQLRKRTGRSSTPVSRSVESLIRRGLLEVQDDGGRPLPTARERRAARSRLFFRLGEKLLMGTTLLYSPHVSLEPERVSIAGSSNNAVGGNTMVYIPQREDFLYHGIHDVETTKVTGTQSLKTKESFPSCGIASLQPSVTGQMTSQEMPPELAQNVRLFVEHFEAAYMTSRPRGTMPPVRPEDLLVLARYLERGYATALERTLPEFFASSFGFARRRHYSLRAYLDCVFVLLARSQTLASQARSRTEKPTNP